MKIMLVNPDSGMTDAQFGQRLDMLARHVGPDVHLRMVCPTRTEVTVDSALDIAIAAPEIIQMAMAAEGEGYDAVVLYCFSDPAVDACREAVSIPVVGAGQASYMLAAQVSRQFGVIVADDARIPEKKLFYHQAGIMPERIAGFCAADMGGRALRDDIAFTLGRLAEAGRDLKRRGAQAVVLGCLSMLGMAGAVQEAIGIPVIDSAVAPVVMAEALVRAGLQTSTCAYPRPPAAVRAWQAGQIIL